MTEKPIDIPQVVFEGQSLKAAKAAAKARGEYDPDRNIRPAWVDAIPVPDPIDYGGAFDGFTVTSDADPGL